jgi:fibronectin-binding autotransporter adhesin
MKKSPFRLAALTVGFSLILTQVVPAQSTWTSATSGDWTNAANWTGGIPNASSAAAVFSNNWTGQIITNSGTNTVGQINARDTTANGGGLTLTGGSLLLDNGASQAIISTDAGFGEGNGFRITSTLEGTNGFERQGAGYLDLSGAVNTFTGTVRIVGTNAGSFLAINNDPNLGNSTNTMEVVTTASAAGFYNAASAGAFSLNANRSIVTSGSGDFWVKNKAGANMTIAGIISGTARLRKNDGGTLTLAGSNTFSGGVLLDGGNLVLTNGNNRIATRAF